MKGLGVIILALVLFSVSTFANETVAKKKTAVTFGDQLIIGEVKVAEFFAYFEAGRPGSGSLISLRENFLPEIRRTSQSVVRRANEN